MSGFPQFVQNAEIYGLTPGGGGGGGTPIITTKYVDGANGSDSADGSIIGAFLTNTHAMGSFSDNSGSKPYLIQFNGVRIETTLGLKPFVTLNGYGPTESKLTLSTFTMATTTGTASSTLSNFLCAVGGGITFDLSLIGAGAFTLNLFGFTAANSFAYIGRTAGNDNLVASVSTFTNFNIEDASPNTTACFFGDTVFVALDATSNTWQSQGDTFQGNITILAETGKFCSMIVGGGQLSGSVTVDGAGATFYYDAVSYPRDGITLLNGGTAQLVSYLPNNTSFSVNTFFGNDDSGTGSPINPYKTVGAALFTITDLTGTYNYLIQAHGFTDPPESAFTIKPFVTLNGYGCSFGNPPGLCDTLITVDGNITADPAIGTSGTCNFTFSNLTLIPTATNIDLSGMSAGAFSLNLTNAEFRSGFTYKGRAGGMDSLTAVNSSLYYAGSLVPVALQDLFIQSTNTRFSNVNVSAVNYDEVDWVSRGDNIQGNIIITAPGAKFCEVDIKNSSVTGTVTLDGVNAFYACDSTSYPTGGFTFANGATLAANVTVTDVHTNFGVINHIATAPAASETVNANVQLDWGNTIILGTSYQNGFGEDIIVKIGVLISSATAGQLMLGVGPITGPVTEVIMPALTTAVQQLVFVDVRLPKAQFFVLDKTGTLAQTNTFQAQGV